MARDAADHVRGLVDRARRDVDDEARVRSRQAAGAVRTFADQVGALADGDPDRAGSLAGLVRDGQDRLAMLASRLDDGPTALLDDVRRFARRQPVLFLASAGALGFVAGRLLRASREVTSDAAGAQGPTMGDGMPLAAPVPLAVPPEQVPLP